MSEKNEMDKAFEKLFPEVRFIKQTRKMLVGTDATATIPEYNLPELEFTGEHITDSSAEGFEEGVYERKEQLIKFFTVLSNKFSADFDLIEIQDTISKCCKAVVLAYKYAVLATDEDEEDREDEIYVNATPDIQVTAKVNFDCNSVRITVPKITIPEYEIKLNTNCYTPAEEFEEQIENVKNNDLFNIAESFEAYVKLINKKSKRALLDAEMNEE